MGAAVKVLTRIADAGPRLACLAALAAGLVSAAPASIAETAAEVTEARAWKHPTYTRLVLEMSAAVDFSIFTLVAPDRLVVDFPELDFRLPPTPLGGRPVGAIKTMRYGLFEPGTSRLVLDLAQPARVKRSFLIPPAEGMPHRFVLDLEETDAAAFARAARTTAPAAVPAPASEPPAATVPRRADGKHVVVVDAGHGGVDPGAISAAGHYEKHIALAAARELAARLEATGRYHVVMTRDRDIFLRLRDRVAIARRAGAELFLSLHADSIADASVRGSHVYSLSKTASDAEAAALAASENKSDVIAGLDLAEYTPEVHSILLDLSQRETNNSSAEMANRLVDEFKHTNGHALNRLHRQAGFAVLKAPDVPSVLIELGFLSNRDDEALLATAEGRARIIEAIVHAVDRHFAPRTAASR
jgi:N-acetylmuramoyl-L-alanine amidase